MNQAPIEFPEPPPPKPTPEQILAQVQTQSIQADIQKKAAELSLKQQQMIRDDDFRQDKLEADIMLEAAKIKAQYPMSRLSVPDLMAMISAPREGQTVQWA